MHRHKTPGHMFWTPAPLSRSLSSSSDSQEEQEQELELEQGDERAQVHRSSLELALDQIGLSDDEMGLGPHCGNTGHGNDPHSFSPLPAEVDADEGLDRSSSAAMLGTDLDVSAEEAEYSHTPTKCLNEDSRVSREKPHSGPHSQPHTPSRAPSLPLLISPEELASSPCIIDEILPEIHWSQSSAESSPRPGDPNCESYNPQTETRTLKEHGAVSKIPVKVSVTQKRSSSAEDLRLSTTSPPKPRPRSSKSSCRTKPSPEREAKQNKAALFSYLVPSVRRPDLSKVEPRVRFPKDGYTPPKSRCPLRSGSLSPEPRLVYMSPADIVTTVLLNPSSNAPDPENEEGHAPAALSILPPEFRSRQQAITLMNELQEDNYRLKLKCAEAATTIDRLRLEAKVNLYSDPPTPGLPLHSGLRTQASRPVTLDIPRPQRAEFNTPSCPQSGAQRQHRSPLSSSSTSVRSLSDFDTLCTQAHVFLQNVEAYERSLLAAEGQTEQQLEFLQDMLQKLDTLEKGYMVTKEENKRLQRQHAHIGNFDPQRELESLIFQCGLQMDELKEQVQPSDSVAPPLHRAPPTQHNTPPQTPPTPSHTAADVPQHRRSPSSSSSSVRGVSGVAHRMHQQRVDEGTPHTQQHMKCPAASAPPGSPSIIAAEERKPLNTSPDALKKSGHDQPDRSKRFHSLKEVSVPLVRDLSCHRPTVAAGPQCDHEEARRLSRANGQRPHREHNREAVHAARPSPSRSSHTQDLPQCTPSTSTHPVGRSFSAEALDPRTQSRGPSRGGSVVGQSPSSSLSSLREAPHTTDPKLPSERQRRSQDGLNSPETDSGFMGSEGSRLTPAAATSPVHQREPPGVVAGPPVHPPPGASLSRQSKEGPAVRPKPSWRSRRGEKRRSSPASCSQLHRGRRTHRAADRESVSGHYSGRGSSTSEEDRSDHSSGSSLSSCGPSSRRHGDPLKETKTSGGERFDEAFDELQAEVLRLRDNMDWFVKDRASTPISRSDRQTTVHRRKRDRDEHTASRKSQTDHRRAVSSKVSQTDTCFPQQVSRLTQTSTDPRARPEPVHRPQHRHSSERTDDTDRDTRASVCPECLRRARSRDGGLKRDTSSPPAHCHHCRRCGAAQTDSFSHSDRAVSCVSVCPHPLLLCTHPSHVHLSLTPSKVQSEVQSEVRPGLQSEVRPGLQSEVRPGLQSEVRPGLQSEVRPGLQSEVRPGLQSEVRPGLQRLREGRSGGRVPADSLSSLDEPLRRALRAARSMKHTSRHMVQTLASGLQHQRTLTHTH